MGVVGYAKVLADQMDHPGTGPDLAPKAKGFGPLGQEPEQLIALRIGQTRWSPRSRHPMQAGQAVFAASTEPLTSGPTTYPR